MGKKVVFLTGAGRGLGRAIAEAFHRENFEIIATDIDSQLLADMKDKEGFTCMKLDVTSEKDVMACSANIEDKFGRMDVLISNAGIFDFYPVSEAGADKLGRILDVNFLGLANLTKYFLPLLFKNNGRLIVISSESYNIPAPFQPYAVSKQALESIYNAIKIELGLKGIQCVLIRPGAIQTQILADTLEFKSRELETFYKNEFESFLKTVASYVNRISDPKQVAQLVLKAGTKRKPKSIYSINHNPLVSFFSKLPPFFKIFIIKKHLRKSDST